MYAVAGVLFHQKCNGPAPLPTTPFFDILTVFLNYISVFPICISVFLNSICIPDFANAVFQNRNGAALMAMTPFLYSSIVFLYFSTLISAFEVKVMVPPCCL